MNFLELFQTKIRGADVAKDRLQLLLQHQRAAAGQPDLVKTIYREIIDVISRHTEIDADKVDVKIDENGKVSILAIDIEIPEHTRMKFVRAA